MRSVEVRVSCDTCYANTGEKVQATATLVFGEDFGAAADRVVELCETCAASLTVAELLLLEPGVAKPWKPVLADKPPRKARGARPAEELEEVPCPFCDAWYRAGTGIAIHVRSAHPERWQAKTDWSRVTFDGKRVKVA